MSSYDEKTIAIVNQLFKEIFAIKNAYRAETKDDLITIKRQWMLSFTENNIKSIEQLRTGLKRMRKEPSPFFPSPGEFINLCKPTPEELGAPDVESAYKQAIKNAYPDGIEKKWSHDAIRYAAQKTDTFFLRTESRAKTFPRFKNNYEQALSDYADGRIMKQISNNKTPDKYQEYVGRIKSDINLGLKPENTIVITFEDWKTA